MSNAANGAVTIGACQFWMVDSASQAWPLMWAAFREHLVAHGLGEDVVAAHPLSAEVWQYMGSSRDVHSFRHRQHPVTDRREYVNVELEFTVEQTSAQWSMVSSEGGA